MDASEMGRLGGNARFEKLTTDERRAIARLGGLASAEVRRAKAMALNATLSAQIKSLQQDIADSKRDIADATELFEIADRQCQTLRAAVRNVTDRSAMGRKLLEQHERIRRLEEEKARLIAERDFWKAEAERKI